MLRVKQFLTQSLKFPALATPFLSVFSRGHGDHFSDYDALMRRLDHHPIGAVVDSPALTQILKLLFTPEEARIGSRVPAALTTAETLAKKLKKPPSEMEKQLDKLAEKGLIVDLELKGQRYYSSLPVVPGFMEFVKMRTGGLDLPQKALSKLFDDYMMNEGPTFAKKFFAKKTQFGRAMVKEESLSKDKEHYSEVLDWESATRVVENATGHAVSYCSCRRIAKEIDRACPKDMPEEVCMTFGKEAVDVLTRHQRAREIDKVEALDILQRAKDAGLMQTGDNVKKDMYFMCNCCGCCCTLLNPMKKYSMPQGITTSNWEVKLGDPDSCDGCGTCVDSCPPGALSLDEDTDTVKLDSELCLGCGVCVAQCTNKQLTMIPRKKRVYTPETHFDKAIAMAIERGTLHKMFFDDPEMMSHRALSRIFKIIEKSPPFRVAMAIRPLKSAFLNKLVKEAMKTLP